MFQTKVVAKIGTHVSLFSNFPSPPNPPENRAVYEKNIVEPGRPRMTI